jgi:hypothetical protein
MLDPVDWMIGDPGQNVAQVGLGVEAVEDGGLDQGVEDRGAPAAVIRAGEQIVLPAQARVCGRW